MADSLRLQLQILTSGGAATVQELRRVQQQVAANAAAARQAESKQRRGNSLLGGGIAELAFQYNQVVQSLQNLRATAQPVYDALIASNEKLNAQILSSQTNLASSTRLFQGDRELTDPTEKIQASAGQLRAAIKQIEIDTQSLVGVTSSQVNELFQITLTNAGQLNNQSKQFPDAIAAATELTKGWAASLKVVGIPLNQARQEINSIIKGQITQDSLLAKNLNLTNQQVEAYRSQGRLVDELNKRLEVFVAGNAIAARSVEGISSNILDLSERITRNIGEPLLEPLISSLADVEKFLKAKEAALLGFFNQLTSEIISQGGTIAEAFAPLGKTLLEIGADLGPIALSAIKGILSTLAGLAQVIAPLADLLAKTVGVLADFAATDLGGVVVEVTAAVLTLNQLGVIIAGLTAVAFPGLGAASVLLVTKLGLIYAELLGIGGAGTIAGTGMLILQKAMVALTLTASALLSGLIPLIAAVGVLGVQLKANQIQAANAELEAYGAQILTTADAVLSISAELNRYNKIVSDSGTLTDEQIKRQKQLTAAASAQAEGIQAQIKAQKELTGLNDDQAKQRDNNIKQLEALSARLDKASGSLKIESKSLEDLGGTAELAAKKLEDFNRQINNEGGGDQAAFEAALKGKVALIQSEVTQRRLSVEAARTELEAVRDNAKAELEIRNAAKDAIDKLYDGRIAKVKELIETEKLTAGEGLDELARIRDDSTLEASTRRKAGQQIVAIRREQIAAESAAIAAGQSQIAALQSQQRISEAAADEESTRLKLAEVAKRIDANKVALENATNDTERAKLRAEEKKEQAESDKLTAEFFARGRKRAVEDFDERRNLIKSQNDLGLVDRTTYNQQLLFNDLTQNDASIAQQRQALAKLGADDREGREAINAQIAQLQSKRVEIFRAFDAADLKRQTDFYDQELSALEIAKNEQIISETEFNQRRTRNRIEQTDAEIAVARRELARLGAADVDGANAINARIDQLSTKRLKALEESYAAELVLIKNAQDKALAIVTQSEQQRTIELQQLLNQRLIRQEDADQERSRSTLANRQAELKQARDFESALARTANATRSPETERAFQQQVREARARTLAATLNVIQTEGQELERLRTLALKGIEDQSAARTRSADLQLSQIARIRAARERQTRGTEAESARELNAIEIANRALERQSQLLMARNNLNKAQSDAKLTRGDIDIERLNQALAIRKELESGIISYQEYQTRINRLEALGVNSNESTLSIQQRKLELERQQSQSRLDALNLEQSQARTSLALDQQKNDLANQRLLIEARIAEFKARQAVLDARSNAQTTEQNNRKSIEAANLALTQAQSLAPGRERDRAVADAEARFKIAQTEAAANTANAAQGVELAKQQAGFAAENTQATIKQVEGQNEVKRLQTETLTIQQQTTLEQFKAVEAAKLYANELERAQVAAEALGKNIQPQTIFSGAGVQTIPARAGGGSVSSGKLYIVGENEPELFIPNVSGTILNREQIIKNLGSLPGLNFDVGQGGGSTSNRDVVEAVRSLQSAIEARPPTPIVANFNAPDDDGMDKLFALQRASLRIT